MSPQPSVARTTTRPEGETMTTTDPLVRRMLDNLPHKADGTTVAYWVQGPEPVYEPALPIAANLAIEALRWLAAEANRTDEPGIAGWLNAVEDGVHLAHPDAAS